MGVDTLERYSSYPAVFDALSIPDVIDSDVRFDFTTIAERAGGSLDINQRATASRTPGGILTALNLAHLATISPTVGLAVEGTSLIQMQRRVDGGGFDSTGHLLFTAMKGFLAPVSIEASQNSNNAARLNLRFWALYDGTNPTLDIGTDALTGSPSIATMFRLAVVKVNSTAVRGNQSTMVDFGIDYQVTHGDGGIDPIEGGVYGRNPTITIQPKNVQGFLGLTLGTQTRLAGNVVAYFKKEGVANGTGEHVSVTLVRPTAEIANVQATPNDDPRPSVIFRAEAGGTIAVSTAATIS